MKNFLTILLSGITLFIVNFLMSRLFTTLFPGLGGEYENTQIFRAYNDPLMLLFWISPFILATALYFLWRYVKPLSAQVHWFKRGAVFALSYWLITLPGMFMSYTSFQVSFLMVLSWSLSNLVQLFFAGLIFSKFSP